MLRSEIGLGLRFAVILKKKFFFWFLAKTMLNVGFYRDMTPHKCFRGRFGGVEHVFFMKNNPLI